MRWEHNLFQNGGCMYDAIVVGARCAGWRVENAQIERSTLVRQLLANTSRLPYSACVSSAISAFLPSSKK